MGHDKGFGAGEHRVVRTATQARSRFAGRLLVGGIASAALAIGSPVATIVAAPAAAATHNMPPGTLPEAPVEPCPSGDPIHGDSPGCSPTPYDAPNMMRMPPSMDPCTPMGLCGGTFPPVFYPTPPAPQPQTTIADYIHRNGIQVAPPIHKGDPGAPTINSPMPDGWQPADRPDWAYDRIVYTGPDSAQYPPNIETALAKLTGNVDPQQVIDVAGGELENLLGVQFGGHRLTVSGYPAYVFGGSPMMVDLTAMIYVQATVVVPTTDGAYVLQYNFHYPQPQEAIGLAAMKLFCEQTTITL